MSDVNSGAEAPKIYPDSNVDQTPGMVYNPSVESMKGVTGDPYEVWKASVENPSGTIVANVFTEQGVKIDWQTFEGLNWRGKLHLLQETSKLIPHMEAWKRNGLTPEQISRNVNSILGLTKGLVENDPLYTGK